MYHNEVFKLLIKSQRSLLSETYLIDLQSKIEDYTMKFDESNIFRETPNIIKLLINQNKPSAKEYLYNQLPCTYYPMLNKFGNYTLEAIIIHVLGVVFNSLQEYPVVRVSTLLEQLNSTVRDQTRFNIYNETDSGKVSAVLTSMAESDKDVTKASSKKGKKQKKEKCTDYTIGLQLIHFMVERDMIHVSTDMDVTHEKPEVVLNKGKAYIKKYCYATCNFDLSQLPIKLNLPMVCIPLDWQPAERISEPKTLSDLIGGYLCTPSGDIYNKFRLLTSRDYNNFFIKLDNVEYKNMCQILNGLQAQPFEINKKLLSFLQKNRQCLEDLGLLMPNVLARVNIKEATDLLGDCFFSNVQGIKALSSYHILLKELFTRVQRARYEDFVIKLASAYEGYQLYLPAFMDFRGRIYRSGVLHFHERDLSKSLLLFSVSPQNNLSEKTLSQDLACAAAFKYQKFESLDDALKWYNNHQSQMFSSDKSLIQFAESASDPFQFIAKILSLDSSSYYKVPVSVDASASAYQIMSYLLLNQEMGRRTNLLPSSDGKIQDLYMCLQDELHKFLDKRLEVSPYKHKLVLSMLTRKFVKGLFMPLVYGKTVFSMVQDIRNNEKGSSLTFKECYNLAKLCYDFYCYKYPDIVNLMNLLNLIGWFCSSLDKPVLYSTSYITTVQDYMCSKNEYIWVYNRQTKKRHRVTLRVPTYNRDSRKTLISTCADFIHQKDAYIAKKVVDGFLSYTGGAPVYTVHDNFITTVLYARYIPNIYTGVFATLGSPLQIINKFLYINVLSQAIQLDISNSNAYDERFIEEQCLGTSSTYSSLYRKGEPIPSEYLRLHLESLMPKDLSDSKRKSWCAKITDTVRCYEIYCRTVCGGDPFNKPEEGGKRHAEMWNEFKENLEILKHKGSNYSVHY
jgi:DNA-directed RNA polymerase